VIEVANLRAGDVLALAESIGEDALDVAEVREARTVVGDLGRERPFER